MSSVKRFEDLRIWNETRDLVKVTYNTFSNESLAKKDFGFRSQIQRASISIMNNIAEGFERGGDAEFARFLTMAKGSCGEVRSLLYVAEDLKYISNQEVERIQAMTVSISKGIYTLINHLRK